MKKTIALILTLTLVFSLCACGAIEAAPTETPAGTQQPDAGTPVPETTAAPAAPLVLNVAMRAQDYLAPDESGQTILSFGYDSVQVYMKTNPEAAEKINNFLAVEDELFYSGRGEGDGLNALLEQATDQFTYAHHEGASFSSFSCMRNVNVERGDSRILALRYRVNSFTGGAHSLYSDRAYVFDAASGQLLTLADLCEDKEALEEKIYSYMCDQLAADLRYQSIPEYIEKFLDTPQEDALRALIREGSWLLDETGLAVFSDIYEIGSFADGIVRFHLSYEELDGLIREQWLPVDHTESGSVSIEPLRQGENARKDLLDKVTIDPAGSNYCLYADGSVYDLTVLTVRYFSDGVGFYPTETHWYASELTNGALQIQTVIPEGMPSLMIRYLDAEGQAHSFLMTESGKDGTVLLVEEASATAIG